MAKVLLINPPYYTSIYKNSVVKISISPGIMSFGLAALAAPLVQKSHNVRILDLNIMNGNPSENLKRELRNFSPDFAGITFTTPLVETAGNICELVKGFGKNITVIGGGPHCSSLPVETLTGSQFDITVFGEGDFTLCDIVDGKALKDIEGIAFKEGAGRISTTPRPLINDLDILPFPALNLFEMEKYRYPRITSRQNPVASMETSRGCFSQCIYCNKSIFGNKFRAKSPKRVVDEIEHILKLGYKEIHTVDDGFTTDMSRAIQICQEIQKRNLKFPWAVRGGIRVDRVSHELLSEMKKAGCYHIPFGIESGSQRIIDRIKKGITLKQVERAVNWAKELGFTVDGYFMIGLPGETEADVKETIKFARKLKFDFVKFAITLPLPGTPLFQEIESSGRLKTKDWTKYTFSTSPKYLYDHDGLDWKILEKYHSLAYRTFYFRPVYMLRTLLAGIRRGLFLDYMQAFLNFLLAIGKRQ